jgi:hypothetical protein
MRGSILHGDVKGTLPIFTNVSFNEHSNSESEHGKKKKKARRKKKKTEKMRKRNEKEH